MQEKDKNILLYTFSDEIGMFQFKSLEFGKYSLIISALSYKDEFLSLESTADNTISIKNISLEIKRLIHWDCCMTNNSWHNYSETI